MPHLVSVVMPAYNAGAYIAESIRSVLAQTYETWECVVVDDGSADDTARVARGFADADPRIRVVSRANGGQAAARNTALKHARGSLVAFLDADDLWLPDKLRLQLDALEAARADVVNSDGYFFSDEEPEREAGEFSIVPGRTEGAQMFRLLFEFNRVATLSVLARRAALDAVGLFDEDRRYQNCEDYDLWLRMARGGAIFYGMTEKLMRYRRHAGATTHEASRLLKPMLAVVLKHADAPSLDAALVKRRIRGLYRELVSALVAEGRIAEARASMREFAAWDRGALATAAQRLLLRLLPRHYNYLSRECVYRVEWHAAAIAGKLKRA
ncbi:MAG: glycosyltransferase [Acidobacteria bacterium]|nr:glycosyltransferase [Acidobacteriota bacterium]